jgi:uncharacterized membrane protein HdeD (DUF308 family)
MTCNIDAKGRKLRAISGTLCLLAGIALLVAGFFERDMLWPLTLSGLVLALCGGFQIFESLKGWCAFRAMGLRTPW